MSDAVVDYSDPPAGIVPPKVGLGSMMAGGNPKKGRQADDWYATPSEVTQALLEVEKFEGVIWEPCCGDGAMGRLIEAAGYKVVASDINPRGYGVKRDLFSVKRQVSHSTISNPPFQLGDGRDAADIIRHLMTLNQRKIALVLKSTYFHAKVRKALFDEFRPARIYPLLWRPDFLCLGRPTMEVQWVVWYQGFSGYPQYRPLSKPASLPVATLS
jgi:hypothetical protein